MANARLQFIDALRGVAILMVVAAHAAEVTQIGGITGKVAHFGAYGVQLFFVISAFTIFISYEKSVVRECSPVRNFFIRRLCRIVPVYWAGIVLYTLIYGAASRGWTPAPEPWHFVVHTLLLNNLFPTTQSSVVPGGWSIGCEVLFYLTVPLWFRFVRTRRAAVLFCALAACSGWCLTFLGDQWINPPANLVSPEILSAFWYRTILAQLGCFAFGILLYQLLKGTSANLSPRYWQIAGVAGLGAALVVPSEWRVGHLCASGGFMGLAVALSAEPSAVVVNRFLQWVGRISYSVYLFHFLVLAVLAAYPLPIPFGSRSLLFLCVFVLATVGTLPIAALSHQVLEKPFITLGHRLVARLEERGEKRGHSQTLPVISR